MAYKQLKLWFDKDLALLLSYKILEAGAEFDQKSFVKQIDQGVQDLELKDRVRFIAASLFKFLSGNYKEGLSVLLKILGPENKEETGMFTNFYWAMPVAVYVEEYGLDDLDISLAAIEEITKRNTGEYAIRPYLRKYPEQTIQKMLTWSRNSNFHLRRLASEGGRPRLPWATKLDQFIDDPEPLLPILNNLQNDSSKYVRKSVANCMNDILKDNSRIGKALIAEWMKKRTIHNSWVIKHSIRTLLKKEDKWALDIMKQIG